MDTNYILRREQISLHNALIAPSRAARTAHRGLAAAYGRLLASSAFPHRTLLLAPDDDREREVQASWDDDGGSIVA
jgi:hypothetical protein